MVADSTLKQYKFRIAKLKNNDIDFINSPDSLFKWFEKNELSPSSQKVYLSAVKNNDPNTFPKVLQDKLNELYNSQNRNDSNQKLTDNQQLNFVKWNELVDIQKKLEAKVDKTDTEWKQYLVVSLYTLNAPVRADYGEMEIHKRYDNLRSGNELIWGGLKPVFVFRNYKTAKTYGDVKIEVSRELQNVIKKWFIHLGEVPKYLLGNIPSNSNTFGIYVSETFKKYTGKTVGVSLLRHSYITHIYPSLKTIKQKEALAIKMLHSRDLQEKYVSLQDTNEDD